jgi:thiol:disulfide interchange protein DsbD
MLDLYTLPLIDLKFARGRTGHQHPRLQAYVTGLTATLLATPCSGPLLGGVLAWSVMQPADMIFASFLSVGVGMASPYLICALAPEAVRLLPRPGAWLLMLERVVGIFLLGTTVYLLDILPRAWALALAAVLLIAALRLILRSKAARLSLIASACLACLLAGLWLARDRNPAADWETFTPRLLREALGKRPVLLEFTADWCPNCKLLEMGTLAPSRLEDWKKRYGLLLVRADMTTDDPQRKELLRALGSISLPLTALFAPGEAAARPVLLHGIYSPAELEAALAALNAPNSPKRETAP